jgi:hypothetical protein
MKIQQIRDEYHRQLCKRLIRVRKNRQKGDYPNNADGDSKISVKIAWEILRQLCDNPIYENLSGQSAGKIFEEITRDFIQRAFQALVHLRPGKWHYFVEKQISDFEQYRDLAEIEKELKLNKKLASTFGQDYIVKPDIVISREPVTENEINKKDKIFQKTDHIATLTPIIKENQKKPQQILHASISCKWTLRSDRAQNIRTEAINLLRNRKGHLPHIVAVTAEPTLTRIASLALGTGDIDCVYHFALYELIFAINKIGDESQKDMLNILLEGRRLRDISDLPFDLIA